MTVGQASRANVIELAGWKSRTGVDRKYHTPYCRVHRGLGPVTKEDNMAMTKRVAKRGPEPASRGQTRDPNPGELDSILPNISATASREQKLRAFSDFLIKAKAILGWTNVEMAARAAAYKEDGVFGKDLIGNYVSGKMLPSVTHVMALAKALHVDPDRIYAFRYSGFQRDHTSGRGAEGQPTLTVEEGGKAWINVHQRLSMDRALRILAILKEEGEESKN